MLFTGLCILWSGVLERSFGVEYWSGVEWSGVIFWSGKNDWSCLNRQQNSTGALTWSHSLDVFICPAIFWWIKLKHLPLQNLTPLHSNTPLQISTGLINSYHYKFDKPNYQSLVFDFDICSVVSYDVKYKSIFHSKIWLHSTPILQSKIPLQDSTP